MSNYLIMSLPILVYIMLPYLMLFAALSNAVCIMLFFTFYSHSFLQMLFVFMLYLGLLTHSLFISCINLHHVVLLICWFFLILFSHCVFFMKGICALWRKSTYK